MELSQTEEWDFHLTAIKGGGSGEYVTKYHYTLRNKSTGNKGDDAFAWYEIQGKDSDATLKNATPTRENGGMTGKEGLFERADLPEVIKDKIKKMNETARAIFAKTKSFIEVKRPHR